MLETRRHRKKIEVGEPYSKNAPLLKQVGQPSAYRSQKPQGMSNSFQQRFSSNFPSSSDLYGAAHRSAAGHDGSSYFGKGKFSANSQLITKNAHSVLRAIQEGPVEGSFHSNYNLESFERKESFAGPLGPSQENIILKQ